MAIRKVKLSDTQAHVIGWAPLVGDNYVAHSVGRSSFATFRKLHSLGLITGPHPGSLLTLEGMNVRTSMQMDVLQRSFFISDEISHGAYVIKPVVEDVPTEGISVMVHDDIKGIDYAYAYVPNGDVDRVNAFLKDAKGILHYSNVHVVNHNVEDSDPGIAGFQETTDIQRTEGIQRIMAKVNSRKGFPIATEQDTESTFFGSGGLTYPWWRIGKECRYQENGYTAVDGWEWEIKIEDPNSQFTWITVKLNHALILKAVRAISRLKLSRDSDEDLRANKYMGDHVIQECRNWVFKGPDACDFDAAMADSVLQWATIGEVAYG